jgi:DNA polymerase III epsilon subunit-like protein
VLPTMNLFRVPSQAKPRPDLASVGASLPEGWNVSRTAHEPEYSNTPTVAADVDGQQRRLPQPRAAFGVGSPLSPHELSATLDLTQRYRRWVSCDCETTGFGPDDHVVELAGVEWVDGERSGLFFQSRCKPVVRVHPMAAKKNGLTENVIAQEYANAAPLGTVVQNWERFLSMASDEGVLLVAHNAAFDERFLQRSGAVPRPVVCTMRLFRAVVGSREPATLDDCLKYFGLPFRPEGEAHRAFRDAELAGELFKCLLATAADMMSSRDDGGPGSVAS